LHACSPLHSNLTFTLTPRPCLYCTPIPQEAGSIRSVYTEVIPTTRGARAAGWRSMSSPIILHDGGALCVALSPPQPTRKRKIPFCLKSINTPPVVAAGVASRCRWRAARRSRGRRLNFRVRKTENRQVGNYRYKLINKLIDKLNIDERLSDKLRAPIIWKRSRLRPPPENGHLNGGT